MPGIRLARQVLALLDHYKGRPGGELAADRLLYGFFEAKFGNMSRQHQVTLGRIDYRFGTTNPVVLEFALRSSGEPSSKLYESQNRSELRKLTRVRPQTARMRVLLLLDRARTSIPKSVLRMGYDQSNAGRGRFERHPVRILYVHRSLSYELLWRPKKKP